MARTQNRRFTTPKGTAIFPHLHRPDTKFDANGVYHLKLKVAQEDAEGIIALMEEVRDAHVQKTIEKLKEDKKPQKARSLNVLPVFEPDFDDEGNENGYIILKPKMKARVQPREGDPFEQQPALYDAKKNRMPNGTKVFGGSTLRVAGDIVPYYTAKDNAVGVTLRMKGVQIIELVQGGATADSLGFDEEDGFEATGSEDVESGNLGGTESTSGEDGDNPDF